MVSPGMGWPCCHVHRTAGLRLGLLSDTTTEGACWGAATCGQEGTPALCGSGIGSELPTLYSLCLLTHTKPAAGGSSEALGFSRTLLSNRKRLESTGEASATPPVTTGVPPQLFCFTSCAWDVGLATYLL
jgi:hypothetical protein